MHGRAGGRRRQFWGGFAVALAAVAVALELALLDPLQAGELLAVAQGDQRDALRGTALLADLRHAGADQNTAGRDQHHLVVVVDQHRTALPSDENSITSYLPSVSAAPTR